MTGRAFVLGDDIDTDQLAPGAYMSRGIDVLAQHCLADVRPDFAQTVRQGDVLVAGRNFGMGSSREQAAQALKHLGVVCVLAQSFAGIFYRNAINIGLPALKVSDLSMVADGDEIAVDLSAARLMLPGKRLVVGLEPLPPNLRAILDDGGIIPHLKRRFTEGAGA